jgi:hypothetical protein
MQLDLRVPLGLLFTGFGAVLGVAGLAFHERVQGINVNLWWGIALFLFGAGSLCIARFRRQ